MTEGRDVALLLQFEAHAIDAAGGIDRQNKREVDRLAAFPLRGCRTDYEGENKERECAPVQAATRCIAAPA